MNKKEISQAMSSLAKLGHKRKPRSREFYQSMAKKRWANKLNSSIIKE